MARQLLQNYNYRKSNKYIFASLILLLLVINTNSSYAQPGGGDLCPPEDMCPLDNWLIVLVPIILLLTILHLYRNKKVASKLC
jgi:hypothetical protein